MPKKPHSWRPTEIQIKAETQLGKSAPNGTLTLSAKKLQDILRSLPEDIDISLDEKDGRVTLKAGKSRFNLQSLPAADFPRLTAGQDKATALEISKRATSLVYLTQFAMAVRTSTTLNVLLPRWERFDVANDAPLV